MKSIPWRLIVFTICCGVFMGTMMSSGMLSAAGKPITLTIKCLSVVSGSGVLCIGFLQIVRPWKVR